MADRHPTGSLTGEAESEAGAAGMLAAMIGAEEVPAAGVVPLDGRVDGAPDVDVVGVVLAVVQSGFRLGLAGASSVSSASRFWASV